MRVVLAELAPALGDLSANLDRIATIVENVPAELAVFPELFLSGYRVGDDVRRLALAPGDAAQRRLSDIAGRTHCAILVGAPLVSANRPGETLNAALLFTPDGQVTAQGKRFLPSFGPFEEGTVFTPVDASRVAGVGPATIGMQICYDLFFAEVARDLAMQGADLLVAISAAPVTSRRLFDRLLPARAIENAIPLVYVNRVGAEDGIVFGGGSAAVDVRGETLTGAEVPFEKRAAGERVELVEIDLGSARRWRPFRPVLRDASRRAPEPVRNSPSAGGPAA
ncbi:MAG TPA: carbon-nitrogen hydrolase family protein [Thermoplasmata archaeon]|nr:carbon-nitrogen hydrolase family protein [Thermoplasmata archaeon]